MPVGCGSKHNMSKTEIIATRIQNNNSGCREDREQLRKWSFRNHLISQTGADILQQPVPDSFQMCWQWKKEAKMLHITSRKQSCNGGWCMKNSTSLAIITNCSPKQNIVFFFPRMCLLPTWILWNEFLQHVCCDPTALQTAEWTICVRTPVLGLNTTHCCTPIEQLNLWITTGKENIRLVCQFDCSSSGPKAVPCSIFLYICIILFFKTEPVSVISNSVDCLCWWVAQWTAPAQHIVQVMSNEVCQTRQQTSLYTTHLQTGC